VCEATRPSHRVNKGGFEFHTCGFYLLLKELGKKELGMLSGDISIRHTAEQRQAAM
jgi:hypothetical protein